MGRAASRRTIAGRRPTAGRRLAGRRCPGRRLAGRQLAGLALAGGVLASGVLAGGVLAACGGARPLITPPSSPTGSSAAAQAPGASLRLASVSGVGRVLVDADGFTLYLFVPDHRGPTRCDSLCLAEWPPLMVPAGSNGPAVGSGLDAALVGSDPLPTGARQVTYGGWPLYLWAGDSAPGQANGEGVVNFGGPWWAVSAQGQAVEVRTGL